MKFLKIIIAILLCFAPEAEAKKKKSTKSNNPLLIKNVMGESSETITLVTLTLNKALKDKDSYKITEHGRYIQLDLKNMNAAQPGSFYETNSPYLNKMALFETSDNTAALRIFTDEDAAIITKIAEIDILENRIILSLDHKILRSALTKNSNEALATDIKKNEDNAKDNKKESSALAKEILVDGSSPEILVDGSSPEIPATAKEASLASSLTKIGAGKSSLDLSKSLRMVGLFMAFMFILLLGALTFKRFKRNAMLAGQATEDALKTLGTLTLNPKQQLNLVEVGGEKILLSVSNDSVSLISHIGQKAIEDKNLLGPAQNESHNRRLLSESAGPTAEKVSNFPDTLKALRKKAHEIEKRQTLPRQPSSRFSEAMETGQRFAPNRKQAAPQRTTTSEEKNTPSRASSVGKKVNIKVGDDGISKVKDAQEETIKDVTSLIRNKLKDLPKF
jgi:flagellar biogenesis protein FliO